MFLNALFSKKSDKHPDSRRRSDEATPSHEKIHLDALESIVGGRSDVQGVGCYLGSSTSQGH